MNLHYRFLSRNALLLNSDDVHPPCSSTVPFGTVALSCLHHREEMEFVSPTADNPTHFSKGTNMRDLLRLLFGGNLCSACQRNPKASKCLCRSCHARLQQFLARRRQTTVTSHHPVGLIGQN